jgi:DNA-binding NtrC family response regulator
MHSPSTTKTRFSEGLRELAAVPEILALTILCHPDARRVGEWAPLHGLNSEDAIELSRHRPLFAALGHGTPRGLDVSYVSRKPLRLLADGSGEDGTAAEFLLERRRSTTPVKVNGQLLGERCRFTAADVQCGVVLEFGGRIVLLFHRYPLLSDETPSFGLVGESAAMQRLRREIVLAANADAPVLLRGASGTGKELVARAVHDAGERSGGPWVAVNMAAIPPSLAASELFGSRKGAFTGADRRKDGFFLAADGGTLFLDEIGDTPAEVQPLLLRALESGEIQPVGSAQSRRVDVRVVAATDADLEARLDDGRFRTPLFHRLAGFEVRLPSLAERRDDIGRLLVHFLARELGGKEALLAAADAADERPWPPAPLVAQLAAYDWPGNVRQLVNVARRLAIARRSGRPIDLGPFVESLLTDMGAAPRSAPTPTSPQPSSVKTEGAASRSADIGSPTGKWRPVYRKASEVSEDELVHALRAADFGLTPTAEALGVSRSVLYQLIEKCPRVRKAGDLGREEIEQVLTSAGDEIATARVLEVSLQGLRLRMKALGLR